jgi:hypothetical protein
MNSEEVHIGATVRVSKLHRIAERRGKVGRIVERYGGRDTWPWTYVSRAESVGCSGPRISRKSLLPDRGGVLYSLEVISQDGRHS